MLRSARQLQVSRSFLAVTAARSAYYCFDPATYSNQEKQRCRWGGGQRGGVLGQGPGQWARSGAQRCAGRGWPAGCRAGLGRGPRGNPATAPGITNPSFVRPSSLPPGSRRAAAPSPASILSRKQLRSPVGSPRHLCGARSATCGRAVHRQRRESPYPCMPLLVALPPVSGRAGAACAHSPQMLC